MKRLLPLVFGLALACPGPGPGPGDEGEFISLISPSFVAQGRTKTVSIRGEGVDWTGVTAADVSFGDGITVSSVSVVDPTNLDVDVTAAADATIGARDVTVQGLEYQSPFQVVVPVLISEVSRLAPGSFFTLTLRGFDTDWNEEITTIDLGPGLITTGMVLDRPLRLEVPTADRVEVFGYVDFFATEGTRSIEVVGEQYTDTLTDVLTVEAPTINPLMAGTNNGTVDTPLSPVVYELTAPFRFRYDIDLAAVGPVSPVAVLFQDGGSGTAPLSVIRPATAFSKVSFDPNDEHRYLLVYDSQLDGGDNFDFTVDYAETDLAIDPTALPEGMYLADQEIAAAGDENWYYLSSNMPWQLSTVELTTTAMGGGGSTLDAVLRVLRDGADEQETDDTGVAGGEISQPVLLGTTNTAVVTVRDSAGTSMGPGSRHDILWNEIDLPGTRFESFTQTGLNDPVAPGVGGITNIPLDVAGIGTVDEVRVVVDLVHPHTNELRITLVGPGNMPQTALIKDAILLEDSQGLTEAYSPDITNNGGTIEVTDLTNFQGTAGAGTWTLQVEDTVPSDAGVVRGWGLFITEQ